jgi:hypothetical protein
MSSSPSRPTSDASATRGWRVILMWTTFAVTLVIGLTLAVLHGKGVPVLLDVVSR